MGTLPATGANMSMGRVGNAYYGAGASVQTSIGNTAPVQQLNDSIGRGATTLTNLSTVFGGRITPFTY